MLKKIFFVALLGIKLIDVDGRVSEEFLADKKLTGFGDVTLFGYSDDVERTGDYGFELLKDITEEDEIIVDISGGCKDFTWQFTGNICDIISNGGMDNDEVIQQKRLVELAGFTKCPLAKGTYTMVTDPSTDLNVVTDLGDERCEFDLFSGTMTLKINDRTILKYSCMVQIVDGIDYDIYGK